SIRASSCANTGWATAHNNGRRYLADAIHPLVVKHRGKRIVEVVKESLPLLVLRRLAEALLVVLDAVPTHEKQVVAFALEATLQLVPPIPRHRGDDRLRFSERGFERRALARPDLQRGCFEDHLGRYDDPGWIAGLTGAT